MNFERFERELQDLWAEIGILRAAINFPEGNLLSLNEDLKVLRSDVIDFFSLSDKADDSSKKIQVLEENYRLLKEEFDQFKGIMVLRMNTMAVDAIKQEGLLDLYINNNNFNRSIPSAFRRIYYLERDVVNIRRRVEFLAEAEANQLLDDVADAVAEETFIIEEA